jgi:hypothetical protein
MTLRASAQERALPIQPGQFLFPGRGGHRVILLNERDHLTIIREIEIVIELR